MCAYFKYNGQWRFVRKFVMFAGVCLYVPAYPYL